MACGRQTSELHLLAITSSCNPWDLLSINRIWKSHTDVTAVMALFYIGLPLACSLTFWCWSSKQPRVPQSQGHRCCPRGWVNLERACPWWSWDENPVLSGTWAVVGQRTQLSHVTIPDPENCETANECCSRQLGLWESVTWCWMWIQCLFPC